MQGSGAIVDLGVEEVRAGIADGSILLVDVREPAELAGGMIPGSVGMPLSRFDAGALRLREGQRIVFSCAAGVRSRMAVEAARRFGLAADEHLAPGFKGWVRAGLPVGPGPG